MTWDTTFALPAEGEVDIYRLHQQVWSLAQGEVRTSSPGRLLFAWERRRHGILARVRTPGRGRLSIKATLPERGRLTVRLATVRRLAAGGDRPLEDGEVAPEVRQKFAGAGMQVSIVSVGPTEWVSGTKREHRIVIPARTITLDYTVTDRAAAWAAYRDGLGRARGFGCGMLVAAA